MQILGSLVVFVALYVGSGFFFKKYSYEQLRAENETDFESHSGTALLDAVTRLDAAKMHEQVNLCTTMIHLGNETKDDGDDQPAHEKGKKSEKSKLESISNDMKSSSLLSLQIFSKQNFIAALAKWFLIAYSSVLGTTVSDEK